MKRPAVAYPPLVTTRWSVRTRRRVGVALVVIVLVALLLPIANRHARAASLLLRLSGSVTERSTGTVAWVVRRYDHPLEVRDLTLRSGSVPVRARLYLPRGAGPWPAMVIAHGVHYRGIDEPRLLAFARSMAGTGVAVLTPQLDALADYRVEPSTVGVIRDAALHLSSRPWARGHRAGVMGLSFAGGLSLLAAADPALRGKLSFVASVGGHHDLGRVSRYLALDELTTPEGTRHAASHDYGLVVFVYAYAERFVDAPSLPVFRESMRTFLHGDRRGAERVAAGLTGDAAWLAGRLLAHDKPAVATRVVAVLPSLAETMREGSPAGHLDGVTAPVYLLHGSHDDVIPPSESRFAAMSFAGRAPVHLLLTSVVDHVTVQRNPTARQRWEVVHFMAGLLGE